MAKIEDGGPAFYKERRLGDKGRTFELTKIRCMKVDANQEPWSVTHDRNQVKAEYDDPRNTRVGRVMRRVEAEELPQLGSVLAGEMSLVDVRAIAPYAHEYMHQNIRPEIFNDWDDNRLEGKPGLFSLNSAVNNSRKNDLRRIHYDRLYGRRASLGLDLFVLYRTGLRMGEKVYRKALDIARGANDRTMEDFGELDQATIMAGHLALPLSSCVPEASSTRIQRGGDDMGII